jgi:hypothetical protein
MVYPPNVSTDLDRALYLVERIILDGLAHGHFELSVRSELVGGGKRQLIVTAGNSYRFAIAPEDLKKSG